MDTVVIDFNDRYRFAVVDPVGAVLGTFKIVPRELLPQDNGSRIAIIAVFRQGKAGFDIERLFVFKDELPKTISGKIQRNKL